jgi:hypothetical protein
LKLKLSLGTLTLAAAAWAAPVWNTSADLTGTRLEGSGLITGNGFATDNLSLSIAWNIAFSQNTNLWTYSYTFAGVPQNISHVLLELSPNCLEQGAGCVQDPSLSTGKLGNTEYNATWGPQGNSNPGIDGYSISGVKFGLTDIKNGTLTFLSNRAPVWGDIYFKGGQGYVFNAGLKNHASEDVNLFVARPDTVIGRSGSETPEPSTMVMLGSGLALAAWIRRRKVSSLS